MLRRQQAGVTLLELVVGMVVLGIAITLISASLLPLAVRSTDPWHQVRAAELGQSLLNSILARRFDQQSPLSGRRCDDTGTPPVPACSSTLGPDSEPSWHDYNDVDDFNGLSLSGAQVVDNLDPSLADIYNQYRVQVTVVYDGAALGLDNRQAKRINVAVTTPEGNDIVFSAYRGNW
ncbi:prepilin-type N-terminal cleavage/methylation domain-containing protein [Gallaecimonas pentaromativorans]|uniref:MSHA pilin protein MshD n=1 Tax=Gallaecimonas pentaromativorans TaxID=584787 RepID=A0A3N1PH82_9GAMM|nr:prepilin-type N-terminal cleavage/methylation domain-containing protein [Gallaecimonas pentaromativorans]ROQ30832.1 MSHA pilin protein MshD [Gallaecimonas pentaromativorans]